MQEKCTHQMNAVGEEDEIVACQTYTELKANEHVPCSADTSQSRGSDFILMQMLLAVFRHLYFFD